MKVMFKDSNGSIGIADDHPATNGKVYVTWNMGKAANGEYITSQQSYSNYDQLVQISEEHYQEYVNCPAWSEEQKVVRTKILGVVQLNESKSCRECAHWAADPDDEYCAHSKAMAVSPVGIALGRGRGNIRYKPTKPEDDPAFSICGPEGKLWEQRPESRRLKRLFK